MLGLAIRTLSARPMASAEPDIRIVDREGWWEVVYPAAAGVVLARTANELHLPAGQSVIVEVVSCGVETGQWLPSLRGTVTVLPGATLRFDLTSSGPGLYRVATDRSNSGQFEAGRLRAGQPGHAALAVVVETPGAFKRWLLSQRDSAAWPSSTITGRGADVFDEQRCAECHAVRGHASHGRAGPDLTHVASRLTLGGGAAPNDADALAGWVLRPHAAGTSSLSSGLLAPSPADSLALVAYLQSLK
jgi:cytochrome c oxidase subunit II